MFSVKEPVEEATGRELTRLFSDVALEVGGVLELPEREARHLFKVLRARKGDRIGVVDADQRLFAAELRSGGRAEVIEERKAARDWGLVALYQAVPKGRHMDLVVEKATELGAGRIVPVLAGRGVVRLEGGAGNKVARWQRVAEAAARQSLRMMIPEVMGPVEFSEALPHAGGTAVILHNAEGLPPLEEVLREMPAEGVGLFVGPEGGWSDEELELAAGIGVRFAGLGPFRLRSETAGVVAVARATAALECILESREVPGGALDIG